jgi:type II secretory pathway predicted ATPase ExeA
VEEVSDARIERAWDIDKAYELIAGTVIVFGNSASGKTMANKKIISTSHGNQGNIYITIYSPHFKDLE